MSEHKRLTECRKFLYSQRPNRIRTVWKMNFGISHAVVHSRLMLVGCEMMEPNQHFSWPTFIGFVWSIGFVQASMKVNQDVATL